MQSQYLLQIVERETGEVVKSWEPGSRIETELLTELSTRLSGRGIGLGRTTVHVLDDLKHAWAELLFELKSQVIPPVS